MSQLLRYIRATAPEAAPDRELLDRYARDRDEEAFAAVVRRYGGGVMAACRRLAGRDAEDVFQAVFLTLARKAGSVRASLPAWLHEVARRVAANARRGGRRRAAVEASSARPAETPADDVTLREGLATLDEELARLPERYRAVLIVCCLEGRSRDEAAAQLGWSEGQVRGCPERARETLRSRLGRRGIELGGVLLAATVANQTPAALLAAGRAATPAALALSNGVVHAMTIQKFKVVAAVLLLASAVGAVTYRTATGGIGDDPRASAAASAKPQEPPAKTEPKPRDADAKADAGAPSEALPPSAVARLGSVRLRTAGSVMRLAFSPDGTRLASYSGDSYDDELTVWDTRTGSALRRVERPGVVRPLAWLPDGRGIALATPGDGRAPLVWEFTDAKAAKPEGPPRPQAQTGIKVVPVPAERPVQDGERDACFAVSPDGKILAVGKAGQLDKDREVQFWEFKAGVRTDTLKPLKGGVIHPGNCGEVHFTPDAKALVVITPAKHLGGQKWEGEQLVTVWDVRTSRERVRFKTPRPAANGARRAVAVSDTTLAIGLEGGDTSLWDLATGTERKLATGHVSKKPNRGHGTYAVAFGPGGKTLATGGWDNTAKLWDVATGQLLHTFASHSWVEALAVSPDGKLVASAGQDGQIRMWDAATGADACPLPGHKYIVGNVALTPDGKQAVTSGWDNTVRWWDVATGEERRSVAVPGGVRGMALSPDGRVVLATTDDGGLRTWDFATGRETTPADLPADAKCEALSFTPDGKHIVAAAGPRVTVWEWPALKVARTIDMPKPGTRARPDPEEGENHCQAAAVSPDGKWLVTVAARTWYRERDGLRYGAVAESVVDLWDFATGKRVRRLAESSGTFRSGTFTADGRFVLIGGGGTIIQPDGNEGETFEGQMTLLDPAAGKVVRGFDTPTLSGSASHVYSGAAALSPDGRTLWVSYNTGEIVGFDMATGRQARTLVGHRGYVGGLAFTTDGRRLISGSRDGTALVWDVTPAGPPTPRDKP